MPRSTVKRLRVGEDAIDVHGHVNNQEYLRWMEEIAIEHSTAQGWPMERYLNSGASWYVRSHFVEYLRPALLGDEIGNSDLGGSHDRAGVAAPHLVSANAGHRRQVLARAETQWTFVDILRGRAVPIPGEVRSAFEIVRNRRMKSCGRRPDAG